MPNANAKRNVVRAAVVVLLVVAAAGCQSQYLDTGNPLTSPSGLPTPQIVSITPSTGRAGSSVTIAGINFGLLQGSSTVMFANAAAGTTSWAPNSIVATVPAGAPSGNVVVNAGGLNSNGVSFTVTP